MLIADERAQYTTQPGVPETPASTVQAPASRRRRNSSRSSDPAQPTHPGSIPQPPASPPPEKLTEQQLTALWRGRRFPAGALVTRAGVPVNVIFQGRPGRGPGPDFRDAVIAAPSGLPLRGDVELHVRASSFRAHGHASDPAYANVILHVVFDDEGESETALSGGRSAPVIALAPWVTQRAGELQRWLQQPLLWREPCHDAVIRLGHEGAGAALDALGQPSALMRVLEAGTVNEATALLTGAAARGYWLSHYDLCAPPCRMPPGFIGRSRALEIIINVVLPVAAAAGDGARARSLFARLPRPSAYGATKFIEAALASDGARVPLNARRAQGLLALNKDWCTQGGCGVCPLS